ncbi:hypothetical protein QBC46DRAFT_338122 [Diplogelasinospora grovesii]|uniref:PKS/mFAS DH domain-containing protein n=1 Tax=Diplogelasinospora grovesii TaxID=303347 RepID=A0AAN6NDK6_9PEZI|nr:hypothetical protein QBC46DRAFT_338122 [Diplogelasinospora grovesii]
MQRISRGTLIEVERAASLVAGRVDISDGTETCGAVSRDNINHNREEQEKTDLIPGIYWYPWTRQKYWYESRISQQHRLKPFARHDLLGTLADWSSDLEPTWRNSRILFPVAGFMSMAIEAANQRASLKGIEASRLEVNNFTVTECLFLEDGFEFEVLLTLRSSNLSGEKADEFHNSSQESGRGWIEHCTGVVKAETPTVTRRRSASTFFADTSLSDTASSSNTSNGEIEADAPATLDNKARKSGAGKLQRPIAGSGESIYKYLGTLGVTYPRSFQSLIELTANETEVAAR